MPLKLQSIGNLLAYVAAFLLASAGIFSGALKPDARNCISESPGRRLESAIAKLLFSSLMFPVLFRFYS